MILFQLNESAKKLIVLRIADQRIVQHMIAIIVLLNLLAQIKNLPLYSD